MERIQIRLEGAESIVVRTDGDEHVVLENPGRWRQRLRREEAWELTEALDAIATAASETSNED